MRFKKRPQLPGAGRARAGYHHGSHTPTSPGAILLGKMAYHTKQIRRECRQGQKVYFSKGPRRSNVCAEMSLDKMSGAEIFPSLVWIQ